jgi:glycosyltransferase involved in cell wall biosynthesis
MRIGIDAAPIVGGEGGVRTHTTELLKAMVSHDKATEFFAYIPPGTADSVSRKGGWTSAPNVRWIEAGRWKVPWRARKDRLDLFHGPNFKMRAEGRCGGIVTIHDMWLDRAPEYSTKTFGQRWSFQRTRRTVWRARKVVTVSRFSAGEIAELYGLPPERIAVIPNGVSETFWPERNDAAMKELRQRIGLATDGFILFVGGADPRKNHRGFLAAAAKCREAWKGLSLVLVGDPVHKFGNYRDTAKAYELESEIVCTGRVSPDTLRLLYSYARLFVFPSRYEGFGMPVLEAMACGAPTITSTTSALPEVAGGAALLADPDNPEEMAEAMTRVLTQESLREDLRGKGFARVKEMTWHAAAVQTLNLYRDLCVGGRQ